MKTFFGFLIAIFFIVHSNTVLGQKWSADLYKRGLNQFQLEVEKSLTIESGIDGRIYFVELFCKRNKDVEFLIHGDTLNDVTRLQLIEFLKKSTVNWSWRFLKKRRVIIPFFISPLDIDVKNGIKFTNIFFAGKSISKTYESKRCLLLPPVYKFQEGLHIDVEPSL